MKGLLTNEVYSKSEVDAILGEKIGANKTCLLNDDVFLNRPVMPEDFFHNGLPKLCSLAIPFRYMYYENGLDKWFRMALNDIAVINSSFDIREAIRKHPEKFFSYVFRRQAKINKMIFDYNGIAGMFHTHTVQIFQKEVFREIWNRWSAVLDRTCRFRFCRLRLDCCR